MKRKKKCNVHKAVKKMTWKLMKGTVLLEHGWMAIARAQRRKWPTPFVGWADREDFPEKVNPSAHGMPQVNWEGSEPALSWIQECVCGF